MEQDDFRQAAGELTVGFLDPVAVFLATPALLYAALCAAAVTLTIPDGWFPLNALLMVVLASFSFARYALPARDGVLDADWISEHNSLDASGQFCLRYLVVTAVWAIPLAIALVAATGLEAPFGREEPFTGIAGAIMVLTMFMLAVGPVLGCLVATASDDLSELLQVNLWEVIVDSRESTVVLIAAAFGGMACFFIVYGLPLMLFAVAGFYLAPQMENAMVVFALALPVALSPVLLGRLCGVLVRKELADALGLELAHVPEDASESGPASPPPIMMTITEVGPIPEEPEETTPAVPAAEHTEPEVAEQTPRPTEPPAEAAEALAPQAPAAAPATSDAEMPDAKPNPREPNPQAVPEADSTESPESANEAPESDDAPNAKPYVPPKPGTPEAQAALSLMLNRVAGLAPDALADALSEAEELADSRAADPYSAAEVALLRLKQGDKDPAREAAGRAIARATAHGAADVADHIYLAARMPLQMEVPAPVVKQLLPMLTKGGHIETAHALLLQEGQLSEERSKSLAIAAFKLGQRETTLTILDDAAQRWPNATFVDALLARMQKPG